MADERQLQLQLRFRSKSTHRQDFAKCWFKNYEIQTTNLFRNLTINFNLYLNLNLNLNLNIILCSVRAILNYTASGKIWWLESTLHSTCSGCLCFEHLSMMSARISFWVCFFFNFSPAGCFILVFNYPHHYPCRHHHHVWVPNIIDKEKEWRFFYVSFKS